MHVAELLRQGSTVKTSSPKDRFLNRARDRSKLGSPRKWIQIALNSHVSRLNSDKLIKQPRSQDQYHCIWNELEQITYEYDPWSNWFWVQSSVKMCTGASQLELSSRAAGVGNILWQYESWPYVCILLWFTWGLYHNICTAYVGLHFYLLLSWRFWIVLLVAYVKFVSIIENVLIPDIL